MVRQVQKENKIYFQCEECGHFYDEENLAKECENWCRENKSCNLEIVKKAVAIKEETKEKISNPFSLILAVILAVILGIFLAFVLVKLPIFQKQAQLNNNQNSIDQALLGQIQNKVLPKEGFKTNLVLGDVVSKMIECGVIDLDKLNKLYNNQIPTFIEKAIKGSNEPIVINSETVGYLLNIFWPLGLSNKTEFNKNISFSERDLPYLASTGGWWLGKKDNGAEYFKNVKL